MGDKAGDSGQRMDLGTGISLGDREVGLGSRETEVPGGPVGESA